jgi:hypothetical protein
MSLKVNSYQPYMVAVVHKMFVKLKSELKFRLGLKI